MELTKVKEVVEKDLKIGAKIKKKLKTNKREIIITKIESR